MRIFTEKPKTFQQTPSTKSTLPGRAPMGRSRKAGSPLHLQRTVGNQALQRLLAANTQEIQENLTAETASLSHGLSRMPVQPQLRESAQANLTVSSPGDIYEQEADRLAEQVMRMPEPRLQRACACGGSCSHCQSQQLEQEPEQVQTKPVGSNHRGPSPVPSIVHSVLRSPGQPLDPATRAFMEPRFGHDFSRVRVHTGPQAARSAQAVAAQAYTVGSDVVFGAGEFAPNRPAGRRLLAHELTHTIQQGAAGRLSYAPQVPAPTQTTDAAHVIQRRTLGIAGACWFENCQDQLQNFFMIPEDGPPGFHPSGTGDSFRVDDVDGFWFKFHTPKNEWFKIPDIGTGSVTCTEDEEAPNIGPAAIVPFATAGWTDDAIHTPNPY